MFKQHRIGILTTLIAFVIVSGAAVHAQEQTPAVTPPAEETATVIPPPTFTDGRINDAVGLGGLAIYCVDPNGKAGAGTFEEGSVTVWGIGDQKYMELAAYQLRGRIEVHQAPSVMAVELTQTATMQPTEQPTEQPTKATSQRGTETPMPGETQPLLLARATTPTGVIGFFRVGEDQFALQGYDDKGKFFTYTWTQCSPGVLDNITAPYSPILETSATLEFIDVTPEATASVEFSNISTPEATASS